jgi:hypothetical protein
VRKPRKISMLFRGDAVELLYCACATAHIGRAPPNPHQLCPGAALLFVHKAALEIPLPPAAIAKAYNLTPMELRVLLALAEIGGVPGTRGG